MAVAACYVLDVDIGASGADGDTVVAVVDPGVEDLDGRGVLDVDAVRVGAGRRRADEEAVDAHPLAVVELEVELRAVLDSQAADRHVVAQEES